MQSAGWICIGSRGEPAVDYPDATAAATALVKSHASFMKSRGSGADPTQAAMAGLLATPLLDVKARNSLDWSHAWAIIGQWANYVVFLLPARQTTDGGYL